MHSLLQYSSKHAKVKWGTTLKRENIPFTLIPIRVTDSVTLALIILNVVLETK